MSKLSEQELIDALAYVRFVSTSGSELENWLKTLEVLFRDSPANMGNPTWREGVIAILSVPQDLYDRIPEEAPSSCAKVKEATNELYREVIATCDIISRKMAAGDALEESDSALLALTHRLMIPSMRALRDLRERMP